MKKFLLLLLIGFLAACDQAVVDEENLVPEVLEPAEEVGILLIEEFNQSRYWDDVARSETSYLDFRFAGCKNTANNELVTCRMNDSNAARGFYYDHVLYYKDGQQIALTMVGNEGKRRDDDYLQVVFIGELLGVLPLSFREAIESVNVSSTTRFEYSRGRLTMPASYSYEFDGAMLREVFLAVFPHVAVSKTSTSELSSIVDAEFSLRYTYGFERQQLEEVYLWYYFYSFLDSEDQATYNKLEEYYSRNGSSKDVLNEVVPVEMSSHQPLYTNASREDLRRTEDPSALDEIIYEGIFLAEFPDRRREYPQLINHQANFHFYQINYVDNDSMEFYVNAEISKERVDSIVQEISLFHGQLPRILREHFNFIVLHDGNKNVSLRPFGYSFHLEYYEIGKTNLDMKHFLLHEVGHISLDWVQAYHGIWGQQFNQDYNPIDGDRWTQAQKDDQAFITTYSSANPLISYQDFGPVQSYIGSEDVADTLVFYVASRMSTDRHHPKLLALWESVLGNRFALLDELDFSVPPKGRLSK